MTDVPEIVGSALWQDTLELPETIAATLDAADGHAELTELLGAPTTRRVIATANGASWYVASAFWLASLTTRTPCTVLSVPAGLIAAGGFSWREGDVLLAFSSSGELRDLVETVLMEDFRRPIGVITASPDSSLGRAADARAVVRVRHQRAVTHTQGYLGAAAVAFDVLGRWARDDALRATARHAEELLATQARSAPAWAAEVASALPPTRAGLVCGANQAWFAALEGALLLKEVAGIPTEGMEIREGATTGMYALSPEDVVITLPLGDDVLAQETGAICAATGASVHPGPWPAGATPADAVFAHFAHPLALAISLGFDRGRDPDHPSWWSAYEATARGPQRPESGQINAMAVRSSSSAPAPGQPESNPTHLHPSMLDSTEGNHGADIRAGSKS